MFVVIFFIDQNFSGISVFRSPTWKNHEMKISNSTRCNQTINQTLKQLKYSLP